MKKNLILLILYLSFLSIGLPDQMLGIAWPEMRASLDQSLEKAGLLTTIATLCSALAGYLSSYLITRLKISRIIILSTFLTIVGILGFSTTSSWLLVLLYSIPLGLGAGAIDSILNNYTAKHLSSKHVNWLHGFWGIGATIGPMILTAVYSFGLSWRYGFYIVAGAQSVLLIIFIITKNIWQQDKEKPQPKGKKQSIISIDTFLSSFFFAIYTALESAVGLWYYSYMVDYKDVPIVYAGSIITAFWCVYTFGRFFIGAITKWFSNSALITASISISILSFVLLYFDVYIGLIITGLAFSGIYPCMISETHKRFSPKIAETLISHQVGATYLGVAIIVPLIGYLCQKYGLQHLITMFFILGISLFLMDLRLRRLAKK